ncbi:hypothetical protein [Leifsonia aquatica]|uniref:hypothetical protein n=1 Tax=Leifsonia aquatica TaxID=144185 RepID=UPI003808244A
MSNPPSRCLAFRGPNAQHDFDPDSGWCLHGCGLREDGRHIARAGQLINPGPEYSPEAIAWLAEDLRRKTARHDHYAQQAFDLD